MPWANCVRCRDRPFGRQPLVVIVAGDAAEPQQQGFAEWFQARRDSLMDAAVYRTALLRVAHLMRYSATCVTSLYMASTLAFGNGVKASNGFHYTLPLSGWFMGGDYTMPTPQFRPALAAAFSSVNVTNTPAMDTALIPVSRPTGELLRAGLAWNCLVQTASQALQLEMELHPWGFSRLLGYQSEEAHLQFDEGLLETYNMVYETECFSCAETVESISFVPGAVALVIHSMVGFTLPCWKLYRSRALASFPSKAGANLMEYLKEAKINLTTQVMWFATPEMPYGLCCRVPWCWPGIMASDSIDASKYVVEVRNRPHNFWWTQNGNSARVAGSMAGIRDTVSVFVMRMAISEAGVTVIQRDSRSTDRLQPAAPVVEQ
ncbi:unnamed protein product [Heligmosomoides polygyrus]|uniref:KR domain-containing protein n=1 Tax=Heligmosomoides polygyrus TaxID=6339 RepID=A0A183FQE7_HELPZ|nr:unnamed protein product [Heligmosomoides polygyrus]